MTRRAQILGVMVGTLAWTATVSASLMPVSAASAESWPPRAARGPVAAPLSDFPPPVLGAGLGPLHSAAVEFWPEVEAEDLPSANRPRLQGLTDGRSSLDLCLYALLGLGLCKTAPWMKKLSWSGVPEWYHPGGPFQIGHSLALAPDCCCVAQICFVQPDGAVEDPPWKHRGQTLICLWRKSQFIPTILASRGPPHRS